MRSASTFALATLLLAAGMTGCTGSDGDIDSDSIDVPVWQVGDWWLYTFSTPDYSDDTARLVVASDEEEDGAAYMLAISSLTEARRHAVLNHNPFLGRVTHSDLSAFENGVAQPVLSFPIEKDGTWDFTLFSTEWTASVIGVTGSTAIIAGTASDGSRIDYVYDSGVGFFYSFIWTDASGTEQLRMMVVDQGSGHTGDVYFIRGGDLFSDTWGDNGADVEVRDTFLVSDHPSDGDWDEMIYFIDAECGSGSSTISLTLRDHLSVSALERIWGPGASELGTMGTIPFPSGEYTLTVTFTGSTYLRVRIAGGITESWSL